jgi:hypothetical protein
MKYQTPALVSAGKATDLIQGSDVQGSDAGVGSKQKLDFCTALEQN